MAEPRHEGQRLLKKYTRDTLYCPTIIRRALLVSRPGMGIYVDCNVSIAILVVDCNANVGRFDKICILQYY